MPSSRWLRSGRSVRWTLSCGLSLVVASAALAGGQTQVPTTLEDFFQPGTQPDPDGLILQPYGSAQNCSFCHGLYLGEESFDEPYDAWVASMMGQAARDPVWRAAIAVANQDAKDSGEFCIRCHAPGAWLSGRSTPTDGSAFINDGFVNDFEGIVCAYCHRAVNPVLAKDSPAEDVTILASLAFPPGDGRGNGRHVSDPDDVRRGPFDDVPQNMHGVPIIPSPFHRKSELCATCHDLGNPVFERQPDGTYAIGDLDAEHPTQNPHDMFPEQRTYSEWLNSQFANGGVLYPDGRFGGNNAGPMQECQDCHMPDQFVGGCAFWDNPSFPFFPRPDMPQHSFVGANHWLLGAMRSTNVEENPDTAHPDLFPDSVTGLTGIATDNQRARTFDMLRAASDMQVVQVGAKLRVRIINRSGHKLPTGYPEGRRMWINVKFYDGADALMATEYGAYDFANATLDDSATKVYKTTHAIDQAVADATGLPVGSENHLALNNEITFDNRPPPQGFTNAAYEAVGAGYVGYSYDDGQYWDDTEFVVPAGAARTVVSALYQPMTREYAEFLRDENVTDNWGQVVYDLWSDPLGGNRVPPIDMDMVENTLSDGPVGDINGDGGIGFIDLTELLAKWGPCPVPDICATDLDCDDDTDFEDLTTLLFNW